MMKRNEFIQQLSLAGGTLLLTPAVLLQSCSYKPRARTRLTEMDVPLLDEIGEAILPATDKCPGAKACEIGKYMLIMVEDCLLPEEKEIFLTGLNKLDRHCAETYNKAFENLEPNQKLEQMQQLQEEASQLALEQEDMPEALPHYFDLWKNLTVSGYFSSEIGMTQAQEYRPVPGGYTGCIAYQPEQKPWAG